VYNSSEEEYAEHLHQVLSILTQEKLYGNLEKCHILSSQVIFLGYVVSVQGIHVDESKIKAIMSGLHLLLCKRFVAFMV